MDSKSVGAFAVLLLVVSAGCSSFLTGEGPLSYEAQRATVANGTLSDVGYERVAVKEKRINRSVSLGNETRRVEITSYVAVYRERGSGPARAGFAVLSTPKAEEFGQALNPLGALPKRTLLSRVASRVTSIQEPRRERSFRTSVVGKQANVTVFSGTVKRAGSTVDATAYVARVTHGNDYLIAVGLHRANATGGEEDVRALLDGIRHET